jgi:hypothetical protein
MVNTKSVKVMVTLTPETFAGVAAVANAALNARGPGKEVHRRCRDVI